MAWKPNPGQMPRGAAGKRVFVKLRNGVTPVASWPADTTMWTLGGGAFDVLEWQLEG